MIARLLAFGLLLGIYAGAALAQTPTPTPNGVNGPVRQFGAVTANNCVKWKSNNYIQDAGSACSSGGGGSGTVTSFSCVTANGVSCSVANPTTTPAATFTLGAITPSTINGNTFTTGTGTLTLGAAKTATINNTLTFTGTDSSSVNFGAGGTVLYSGGAYVSSFSGDSALLNNSSSTGAVTATLANAAANSVWGNATGSSGAPSYSNSPSVLAITTTTLTANGSTALKGTTTISGALNATVTATFGGFSTFNSGALANTTSVAISTATFTPDFSTGNNFSVSLVHASCPCTIANPSNLQAGQSGYIFMLQSATGSDTIGTWGTQYTFAGGTKPTLSTTASAIDTLGYVARDSTHIQIFVVGQAFQ